MKKLLMTGLAAFAFTVAECREKTAAVHVPEKTIVAAYIDLEKAYDNGKSVASTLIDALPFDERFRAKKEYAEALKAIDKFKDNLAPEWAVVTFGGDMRDFDENSRHPERLITAVIKVNADDDAVKQVLKDVFKKDDVRSEKKNGHIVFDIGDDEVLLGLIDNKYIILSPSKINFDEMFDLYAGRGWGSRDFNDLARISGDTVCRISTAPVASLLTRFELAREVEKFGEACEDRELAGMLLNMGSISLDIGMADKLSLALHVACNSSSDAKTIESLMRSAAFLARIGCDICAFGAVNPDMFEINRQTQRALANGRDMFISLARDFEVSRSWTVATLSVALETAKLADFLGKMSSEKKSSRYDDDGDYRRPFGSRDKKYAAVATNEVTAAAYDDAMPAPTPAMPAAAPAMPTPAPAMPAAAPAMPAAPAKPAAAPAITPMSQAYYRRNAQKAACISNMKQLQSAAEMYMLNHSSTPMVSDLCGPDKYLRTTPTCPKDGSSYRIYREDGEIKVSCPNAYDGHEL